MRIRSLGKRYERLTSSSTSSSSLFDHHGSAHEFGSVHTSDGGISLFGSFHRDESESSRVLGVGISHDLTFLNLSSRRAVSRGEMREE